MSENYGNDHYSLYNQGKTSACWIYAMCTCIEREQLLHGDSITLSRHWLLAREMEEQTLRLYMAQGKGNNNQLTSDTREAFSVRGVGPEVIRLINIYGLVPYTHEKTYINSSSVTVRKLTLLARSAHSLQTLQEGMNDILPQFTIAHHTYSDAHHNTADQGEPSFFYYSMRYTPRQFAESIMYCQNWQFYASVNYHPWGMRFALEVPDNQYCHEYTNIPMRDMLSKTLASLRAGHPVYWEYGNKPNPEAGGVNSNHAMAIIALRKHTDGKTYLVCQNSYGKQWGNNGTCLVSPHFFMRHTCCIGVANE